jgi:hypothetical protein
LLKTDCPFNPCGLKGQLSKNGSKQLPAATTAMSATAASAAPTAGISTATTGVSAAPAAGISTPAAAGVSTTTTGISTPAISIAPAVAVASAVPAATEEHSSVVWVGAIVITVVAVVARRISIRGWPDSYIPVRDANANPDPHLRAGRGRCDQGECNHQTE